MTRLSPQLETARLLLRPPQLEDFERWAEFAADPLAARFRASARAGANATAARCGTLRDLGADA